MSDIKHMDLGEFRELGFLQEVNRLFFHPLGLALEMSVDECPNCDGGVVTITSTEYGPDGELVPVPEQERCPTCGGREQLFTLSGVWDYRDDPEGVVFTDENGVLGDIDLDKVEAVAEEAAKHVGARTKLLGSPIQVIKGPT